MRPSSFHVDCPWRTSVTVLGEDTLGNEQVTTRHPEARDADCRERCDSTQLLREETLQALAGATAEHAMGITARE